MANKNKEKYKNSNRVNEDTLSLLALHPHFLDKIKEIRKTIQIIPENGFSDMNKGDEFNRKLMENSEAFFNSPDFQKKWNQVHEQYDKNEISFIEFQEEKQKLNDSNPLNLWGILIHNFCVFFGLHEGFEESVREYILYNKFSPAPSNWSIERLGDRPEQSKIVIRGPILDGDMKEIFRTALKMTARFAGKYWRKNNPYRQIERDIKILKLSLKKKRGNKKINEDNFYNKDVIFGNDFDLASSIFEEIPENENFSDFDRKKANLIVQARKRLKARILERFPPETFTS